MATDSSSIRKEIDEGLGSLGRIRVVAELAKDPERMLTVYAIAAVTHLKREDVKANLTRLVAIGWVKKYKFVPVKYQINLKNDAVLKLVNFLRTTGYL